MSIYESVFHTTLRVHDFIYEHTNGLVGHRLLGVPCLMLRTTGRKTGQTRTNSLVYARDGDRYLVVASKGGDPKAPAWLLNLRSKPQVQVQIGRSRFRATGTAARRRCPNRPACGDAGVVAAYRAAVAIGGDRARVHVVALCARGRRGRAG
jgi:F420H(2)-dependent quinone reductase